MNFPTVKGLFAAFLTAVVASSLAAATPVIGEQFFQDTNARIDDLFQYRKNPPKPPGPLDNPFRVGDAPLASSLNLTGNSTPATGPVINSDEALLRQAAGSLIFGGLIQLGEVQVLVINKANYKEGGILTVRLQGVLVYLRIVDITSNSVTLGLNEARLTLHF